jgi:hypothetical protein
MRIKRAPAIRFQRDIALASFASVQEAIIASSPALDLPVVAILGKHGVLYELNVTAAVLWELLAQESTLEELVVKIGNVFEADPSEIESDLHSVLAELEVNGLLLVARDA